MVNLKSTKIAFENKSNHDLKREYILFKIMNNSFLVRVGSTLIQLMYKLHLPITSIVKKTLFKQFCGGETITECQRVIENLSKNNIGTILDYAVEGKETKKDFDNVTKKILKVIQLEKKSNNVSFSVFKMSSLGKNSNLEKNKVKQIEKRVEKLCSEAYNKSVPILIDAEETWMQHTIDKISEKMMTKFNKKKAIVYTTVQMYRKDRLLYIKKLIRYAKKKKIILGIKLVRGAYMEKERKRAKLLEKHSPICETKKETDENYNRAITLCLDNIKKVTLIIGTHNEESVEHVVKEMKKRKIKKIILM